MTDYKLMPKQITEEMADAFWEEYYKDRHDDLLMRCYKALYVTAPAPQPTEQKPDVTKLVEALEKARDAIASLPKDSLGNVPDTPERQGWHIRDELIHNISSTLATYKS